MLILYKWRYFLQMTTSYDDLRKKNREEYDQKRVASYSRTTVPPPPQRSNVPAGSRGPGESGNKNVYGKIIFLCFKNAFQYAY